MHTLTKSELTEYNVGCNLDSLMNLDPRGYGVCRIFIRRRTQIYGRADFNPCGKKGLLQT
ncbi:MAG: hypothetical protein L6V88_06805 [Anaerotruncus sp.]|nr:MAG: hypothetical protein L6V88_06805 [Anaerotruncus sp.]